MSPEEAIANRRKLAEVNVDELFMDVQDEVLARVSDDNRWQVIHGGLSVRLFLYTKHGWRSCNIWDASLTHSSMRYLWSKRNEEPKR